MLLKVYEEKERSWERELRKIKALYENRMKANQQKVELLPQQNNENHNDDNDNNDIIMMMQASKMEQALMNQTLQVQNEKRKLESELEDVQVTEEKMRILTRSEGSRDVSLKKKFLGLTNNFISATAPRTGRGNKGP